jgi:hypothetical protein
LVAVLATDLFILSYSDITHEVRFLPNLIDGLNLSTEEGYYTANST